MSKKSSIRVLILIVLLFSLVLSGCDEKTNIDISLTEPEAPFDFESIRAGWQDYRELTVLRPSLSMVPKNISLQEEILEEVNKILRSKINTEIKIDYVIYQKYVTEIAERLFSGDNADIIDSIPADSEIKRYAEESIIADLTDLIPMYYPEVLDDNVDLSYVTIDDRVFIMPKITQKSFQDRVCIVVNRELLEKAGNPIFKTVEDIVKLYKFGLENENSRGKKFLDGSQGRVFAFEFHTLLQLLCQENNVQMSGPLLAIKDGSISLIEDTHLLKDWYDITMEMCEKNAVDHNNPIMFYRNLNLAMGLTYYSNIKGWSWSENMNQVYKVMFVGDYEPYSQKVASAMALIVNNDHKDRSMMALRLLYEDQELNRLIQYGILNKHHILVNNRVELISDSQGLNVNRWWPSLINDRHSYCKVHEPEGAEQYVADLYRTPKRVIPNVSNLFYASALETLRDDPTINEAFEQREQFIINDLFLYVDIFKKGLPYEIFIEDCLDSKLQQSYLDALKQFVEDLQKR